MNIIKFTMIWYNMIYEELHQQHQQPWIKSLHLGLDQASCGALSCKTGHRCKRCHRHMCHGCCERCFPERNFGRCHWSYTTIFWMWKATGRNLSFFDFLGCTTSNLFGLYWILCFLVGIPMELKKQVNGLVDTAIPKSPAFSSKFVLNIAKGSLAGVMPLHHAPHWWCGTCHRHPSGHTHSWKARIEGDSPHQCHVVSVNQSGSSSY